MDPATWFAQLETELGRTLPPLEPAERDALLDLARVAAHRAERWTAPITTYLVGVTLAGAGVTPGDRAARVRALVEALESQA